MKLKNVKLILIILVFLGLSMNSSNVYAIGDFVTEAQDFVASANETGYGLNGGTISASVQDIYNLLLGVGVVITMAVATFLRSKVYTIISRRKSPNKREYDSIYNRYNCNV